jgi:hypothetical protein
MFLAGEHAQETPENYLEAVLRVLWWQIWDRWLFPNDEFQLGHEIDHELTIRAQRFAKRDPPPAKFSLALAQERADKALEGLALRRVRDVALVLVELAGREQATRRYEHLVQLVHHRGLSDSGISGHEHEFGRAVRHHSVKGGNQRVDLALPAVELLRNQQPIRPIMLAEREPVDATM